MTDRHVVLVVEDDPENAKALREMIQSMDMDCRLVASRTEWRAIHTVGGKGATGFVFDPRPGVTYAVIVKEEEMA